MKQYLVAYSVGVETDSTIVEISDDYIPASDSCKLLKQLVVKKSFP